MRSIGFESGQRNRAKGLPLVFRVCGSAWVRNATGSFEQQSGSALHVVSAVNGPDEVTIRSLTTWAKLSRNSATLARKSSKLAPLGSFGRNLRFLSTPRVANLQQDDVCLSDHLEAQNHQSEGLGQIFLASFARMQEVLSILRRHPRPTTALAFGSERSNVENLVWFNSGTSIPELYARRPWRRSFHVSGETTVLALLKQRGDSPGPSTFLRRHSGSRGFGPAGAGNVTGRSRCKGTIRSSGRTECVKYGWHLSSQIQRCLFSVSDRGPATKGSE